MPDEKKQKIIEGRSFRGLNVLDDPTALDPSESPYMPNMDITKDGRAQTRFGYEEVLDLSDGSLGGSGRSYGLASYYATSGTYEGDYLLMWNNGKLFSVKDNDFDVADIRDEGAYGTDDGKVRGTTHNNVYVFGNGLAANTAKTFDGDATANLGGSLDPAYFTSFQSRLFCSPKNSSTAYYSDTNTTDTNLSSNFVVIADKNGEDVTGFVANSDFLQSFKEDSIHGINWSFDDNYNISVPKLQPIVNSQGGAYAPSSIQAVYGYTYYLSSKGFESYGATQESIRANIPLPLSLSVDPLIYQINFQKADEVDSAFFEGKYLCAAPIGGSQEVNNVVFVYNETVKRRFGVDNWSLYTGISVDSFAKYRDAQKREKLYFSSPYDEKIYRFNKTFSDNGYGYIRAWRSKTFQFGERTDWRYIDLEGDKVINGKMDVDLWVDGVLHTITDAITDDNFVIQSNGGGYLGDGYTGSLYYGDGQSSDGEVPMYKWRKRVRFPVTITEGYNMYFEIRNQEEAQGWALSRFRVNYAMNPDDPNYTYAD